MYIVMPKAILQQEWKGNVQDAGGFQGSIFQKAPSTDMR